MQYYYSLLESYQQLKRRKFKLSLREEAEQDAASVIQQVGQGKTSEQPGEQNGVEVWQGEDPNNYNARWAGGSFAVGILKGQELSDNANGKKMIATLLGGGGEDGAGGEGGDEEKEPNPLEGEAQGLEDQLFGTEEKEGMFSKNEEGAVEPSIYFPGYVDAEKHSRVSKSLNIVKKKEAGQEQGLGVRGAASQDITITDKLLASPNLDPEKAKEALETVNRTLTAVRDIHSGKEIPPDQLRAISTSVVVTQQGVMFDGIYMQYRTDSKPKNDMYRNATDQINEKIKENNKQCPDKETEAGKDCRIKEIKAPSTEGRGMDLSKRGPMMEHSTVITQLAGSLENCQAAGDSGRCAKLEARIGEEFETMLADGTMEEAQRMFQDGLCAAGQACLISIEGADAAVMTELTIDYLVQEQGMDEATATVLVQKAADMDDGGTRAMVLLVASTRGFNSYTSDLDVLDSEVFGGEGAALKGQKDDVRLTVTAESFAQWKEKIEEQASETERKLEEAAKCAGDGVGLDSLGKSQISEAEGDAGDVTFGVEQKARTHTTKGRTKMGEGNNNRVGKICKGTEGLDPKEAQFIEANNKRMQSCGGNDKPFDGKTSHEAACSFQDDIDEKMQPLRSLIAGQPVLDAEGKQVKGAGAEMVRTWVQSKSSNDAKAIERGRLASAGFAAYERGSLPTKDQKEAMSKVTEQIEQAEISKKLDGFTDSSGKVTGEGLGYLLQRTGQDSGSLDECVKDVRGYADNTQRLGLINSTTYGTIAMVNNGDASVTRKPGSNSFSIKTTEGEGLMGGAFERGQLVTTVHNDSMTAQDLRNKAAHSPTAEETMHSFLIGQKALLEKLIAQTT